MKEFGAKTTSDEVLEGQDLAGRTMLITGANSGIGFETARSLAAAGAHVVLACRSRANAIEAAERIRAQHPSATLTPVELDLSSFESIRRCVENLVVPKLDVLICNAGVVVRTYSTTQDGLESTVGVSHFGHFLLTQLLLDRLRAAQRARVVVVSSESHRLPPTLKFERFPPREASYNSIFAYGQAKLCNLLFASELTRRFAADGICANALHPGSFIGTRIFRNVPSTQLLANLIKPFTKSVAQGAATTVYCATAPELDGVGGRYFANCREKRPSRFALNKAAAEKLWELTAAQIDAKRSTSSRIELPDALRIAVPEN